MASHPSRHHTRRNRPVAVPLPPRVLEPDAIVPGELGPGQRDDRPRDADDGHRLEREASCRAGRRPSRRGGPHPDPPGRPSATQPRRGRLRRLPARSPTAERRGETWAARTANGSSRGRWYHLRRDILWHRDTGGHAVIAEDVRIDPAASRACTTPAARASGTCRPTRSAAALRVSVAHRFRLRQASRISRPTSRRSTSETWRWPSPAARGTTARGSISSASAAGALRGGANRCRRRRTRDRGLALRRAVRPRGA